MNPVLRSLLLAAFGLQLIAYSLLSAAQVTLTWADNSNNEDGFRVERALGASGEAFVEIAGSVAANATGYVDLAVAVATTYRYRVRAYNIAGNSAYSNTATVTTLPAGTPPNGPDNVDAVIPGTLANLSNRGLITVGDSTMIPGFVITGGPLRVLIRAVGPTIGAAPFNVPGVCADPAISLRNGAGAEIAANDNWLPADAATMAAVGAFALPAASKDAALVITLAPGNYTVVTSGVAGATGVALAEIYAAP